MANANCRQDTHKNLEKRRTLLEVIGREVRAVRCKQNLTVANLANLSQVSRSLLSKIENGSTLPSLRTMKSIALALSVPLTTFFRGLEEIRTAVHSKAGVDGEVGGAGTQAAHQYKSLGHIGSNVSGVVVEPHLITLPEKINVLPSFQHNGLEMLYVLEGEINYRHGQNLFALKPGDTLFFDANAPHGPEGLVKLPIKFLSIIAYHQAH